MSSSPRSVASRRFLSLSTMAAALIMLAVPAQRLVAQCSGQLQTISPCTISFRYPTSTVAQAVNYLITNSNRINAASYSLTCTPSPSSLASCSVPGVVVVPAGGSKGFAMHFTTGSAGGSGTITVSASGGNDDLSATVNLTVDPMSITPKGAVAVDTPSTAYKQIFVVRNTSFTPDTLNITVSCDAAIASTCTRSPTSLILGAGTSANDTVSYTTQGENKTGLVRLIGVMSTHSTVADTGWVSVSVPAPQPPVVSALPTNGDNHAAALCLLQCFDMVTSYSTPSYTSRDEPRSATLVYNSAQAAPMGEVAFDVTDPTLRAPVISLSLQRPNGSNVTFTNGNTELYWNDSIPGATARVSAQFYDSTLTTGVYDYTAIVKLRWTKHLDSGTVTQTNVPVQVLIVNERASVYGAGWSLAGAQRLYFPALPDTNMILVSDGEGGLARFARWGPLTANPAAADFSTITTVKSGGTITGYVRGYADSTNLRFSATGYLLSVKNRFGDSTRYHYDASNRVDSIIDPAGKALVLAYSSNKISTITDPGGRVSQFTVNANGDLATIKDPTGATTFTGTYDTTSAPTTAKRHHLLQRTDRRGSSWIATYDFAGKIATDSTPPVYADSATKRIGKRYQSLEVAQLIDPGSGLGTSTTNYAPELISSNVRLLVTASNGDFMRYAVDRFGASTLVEHPWGLSTETITRDANSLPTRALSVLNGKTLVNQVVVYSLNGSPITQVDSLTKGTTTISYDTKYNLVTSVSGAVATVFANFLNATKSWVDSTRFGVCCSDSTVIYVHDTHGRTTLVRDQQRDSTVYSFAADASFGNLLSIQFGNRLTQIRYDGYGRAVRVLNPKRDSLTVSLDSLNRARSVTDPEGAAVTYGYDSLYLKSVTDRKGQSYSFARDALGWVDTLTNSNSGDSLTHRLDIFWYSARGSTIAHFDRQTPRVRTSFTYDSLGRLHSRTLGNGQTTTYAYDPSGLSRAASNGESIDTLSADSAAMHRIQVTHRGTHRYTVALTADSVGYLRTVATTADGSTLKSVALDYDLVGRLASLTVGGNQTSLSYNRDGILTQVALPTLPVFYVYDSVTAGHMPFKADYSITALDQAFGAIYTRDTLDRIVQRTKVALDTSWTYAYGNLGRLTAYQALSDTSAETCTPDQFHQDGQICTSAHGQKVITQSNFTYDSVGNRTDNSAVLIAGNRLTSFNGFTLSYDYNGNLTHKSTTGFDQYYYWNSIGELDSVKTLRSGVVDSVSFGYDGFGRRVRKSHIGHTLRYVYNGDDVMAEIDSATGAAVRVYTYYGPDVPHSVTKQGKTEYYLQDFAAGHVVALIDSNRVVRERYRYGPWGQAEDSMIADTVAQPYRYAGGTYDPETQLYYFRARYYDPALARFISEDPIGLGGGINQYAYVQDQPIDASDLSGMVVIKACPYALPDGYYVCRLPGGQLLINNASSAISGLIGMPACLPEDLGCWYPTGDDSPKTGTGDSLMDASLKFEKCLRDGTDPTGCIPQPPSVSVACGGDTGQYLFQCDWWVVTIVEAPMFFVPTDPKGASKPTLPYDPILKCAMDTACPVIGAASSPKRYESSFPAITSSATGYCSNIEALAAGAALIWERFSAILMACSQ